MSYTKLTKTRTGYRFSGDDGTARVTYYEARRDPQAAISRAPWTLWQVADGEDRLLFRNFTTRSEAVKAGIERDNATLRRRADAREMGNSIAAKAMAEAKAKDVDLSLASPDLDEIAMRENPVHDDCVSEYVTGALYQIAGRLFMDDGTYTDGQKARLEVLILDVLSNASVHDSGSVERLERLALKV